ncbi:SDR family oxidoreductase [Marinomonas ostreistagni]|uniref:SDR family oxidoreductase n=1 Tax=Marinomonas ostreistagni TaxID=359209 RepID=UPI00194E3B88|nr:SDR family oxidoreductase [Marinomonas ostreistagni]MBM6552353.1 SDR family oxidoreductase [Marinomonas ostreistagni]
MSSQENLDQQLPSVEYITADYKGADKLKQKRVFITGGDSGIGRAVALHMAREGAKVAIMYHSDEDSAVETRRGIEQEGAEALVLQGDTANADECRQVVAEVVEQWGGIDVLVNNAGMQKPYGDLSEVSDDDWAQHFAVNSSGIFYITKAALEHMEEGASIINTTSVNAFVGNDTLVPYTATKGAIVGFTRALAAQVVKRGIRVNQVAPGPIATEIQLVFKGEHQDVLDNMTSPMGRIGQPYELGPAYVFLACRDSSFITGQTIHVNGGMATGG